jgi:hypothetical protein
MDVHKLIYRLNESNIAHYLKQPQSTRHPDEKRDYLGPLSLVSFKTDRFSE